MEPEELLRQIEAPELIPVPASQTSVQECPLDETASYRIQQRFAWSLLSECWADTLSWAETAFQKSVHGPWAFDAFRVPSERVIVVPPSAVPSDIWFIGDLHGDLLALEMALYHIEAATHGGASPFIVFLGDLVDDGKHGFAVFLRVLRELAKAPGRIGVLAGNHDEAVFWDGRSFATVVEPSGFAEWMNTYSTHPIVRRGGELFQVIFTQAPRAVFLGDGLFAAHAGFPHTDLHSEIRTQADLERPECLQDFVWTRASSRASKKLPNRNNRGCQFGYQDFDAFCALAQELLGRSVNHLVRGHDHVEERYDLHPDCQVNTLTTINTLGHRLGREFKGAYSRTPCVARKRSGEPLEVHRLMMEERFLTEIYPVPLEL